MEFLHLMMILWPALSETYGLSSVKEIRGRLGGEVWIPCYYDVKYGNNEKFFFQKRAFGPRTILARKTPILRKDRITTSDDKSQGIYSITMRNLTKSDVGNYYCGLKGEKQYKESYLYLSVDAGDYSLSINSNSNVFTGQDNRSVDVPCKYTNPKYVRFIKYWCRGRDFNSCQTLKRSDLPDDDRVSIKDNTTSQEFTVTMTNLQRTDTGWYWCAIEKLRSDERVPVYIRVLPASENESSKDGTLSSNSVENNEMIVPGTAEHKYNTGRGTNADHCCQTTEKNSVSGDSRAQWTIGVVIGGLFLLVLTAGVFTIRLKRSKRGGNRQEKRIMQPQEKGRTPAKSKDVTYALVNFEKKRLKNELTEPKSQDMHYAVISFQAETKEDTKKQFSKDSEDKVIYSVVGVKGTVDMCNYED